MAASIRVGSLNPQATVGRRFACASMLFDDGNFSSLTRLSQRHNEVAVLRALTKSGANSRHVTATVLLLAVFALPFHLHFFTPTAQIAQECSCYHGVRTQAGLAPVAADWTPTFQASFLVLCEPQLLGSHSFGSYAIRAPPSGISL